MTDLRENLARAIHAIEVEFYGGTDWNFHGTDDEYSASPEEEREMAYKMADAVVAIFEDYCDTELLDDTLWVDAEWQDGEW